MGNNPGEIVGSQSVEILGTKISCLNFIFEILAVWRYLSRKCPYENDLREY